MNLYPRKRKMKNKFYLFREEKEVMQEEPKNFETTANEKDFETYLMKRGVSHVCKQNP